MKKISFFLLAAFALFGCQGFSSTGGPGKNYTPSLQSESRDNSELLSINSLLVAAVEADSGVLLKIPANINPDEMLAEAIGQEIQMKVFRSEIKSPVWKDYAAQAKMRGADGVLLTRITHFSARQGSAVGSANPARVDLTMQIVRPSDGHVVWQSNYHYKDQALSDNLFKLKERFAGERPKFRSADELLREGYSEALKDFSKKRLGQFVR